jgi:hypothetical protein
MESFIVGNQLGGVEPLKLLDGVFPGIHRNIRVDATNGCPQPLYQQDIFKGIPLRRLAVRRNGRRIDVRIARLFEQFDGEFFDGRFSDFSRHLLPR